VAVVAKSDACISGNQLDKILERFNSDSDRLHAVERLAHKVVSPEMATLDGFMFPSNKRDARRILAR
jgi:hypothetical protein